MSPFRHALLRLLSVTVPSLLLAACAHSVPAGPGDTAVPTILISLDGFRADYLDLPEAGNLRALAASGVRAASMHPSFPSTTLPNHMTLVTGLRPDRHGVVSHVMEDASLPGQRFSTANQEAMHDSRWWDGADPVWVTAELRHVHTAMLYWPGSDVLIHGVRPSEYRQFDDSVAADSRVNTVLEWLQRPPASRPAFVGLYLSDVDSAGHAFGPGSREVAAAVARVDHAVGRLVDGLRQRGIAANLVVVSDHGMSSVSTSRLIRFDQVAPAGSYRLVSDAASAGIEAQPGQEAILRAALLKPHPHMQCWDKAGIPEHLHYGQHARVPAFLCLAEAGWLIVPGDIARVRPGNHGYDPAVPDMQAIFIASGPALRQGVLLPSFDNVNVYPLLMKLLGLPANSSDGTLAPTAAAMR